MADPNWVIRYKVPAITGDKILEAGPYSHEAVDDERNDISCYEGVVIIDVAPDHSGKKVIR